MTFASKTSSLRSTIRSRDPLFKWSLEDFREWLLGTDNRVRGTAAPLWHCEYCREIVGLEGLSIDHALPLKWGGLSDGDNLVPCCKPCNSAKGELGASQFRELRSLARTWPALMRTYLFRKLMAMPQGWLRAQAAQRGREKLLRRIKHRPGVDTGDEADG